MPHRTAVHDEHVTKGQAKVTKDEVARRYTAHNEVVGAPHDRYKASKISHVSADLRDEGPTTMSGGG